MRDYIKTEAKVYLDGKEVTNFFTEQVQVIRTDEANSDEVLKLYDSFSGTITLSGKQVRRFIRCMKKAQKHYFRGNLFKVVQGWFKKA